MSSSKLRLELNRVLDKYSETPLPTAFVEFLPSSFKMPQHYGIAWRDSEVWLYALENDQMWAPPFGEVALIDDIPREGLSVVLRFLRDHSVYLAALWAASTTDPDSAIEFLGDAEEWVSETALYRALEEEYARKLTA